jgi:hypothetical protein
MHHQFGSIAGDEQMGGVFSLGDGILVNEYATVAVESLLPLIDQPIIALEIVGRINKTKDTFQAVFVLSLLDAGSIVASIVDAVRRLDDEEAMKDFQIGVRMSDREPKTTGEDNGE